MHQGSVLFGNHASRFMTWIRTLLRKSKASVSVWFKFWETLPSLTQRIATRLSNCPPCQSVRAQCTASTRWLNSKAQKGSTHELSTATWRAQNAYPLSIPRLYFLYQGLRVDCCVHIAQSRYLLPTPEYRTESYDLLGPKVQVRKAACVLFRRVRQVGMPIVSYVWRYVAVQNVVTL